ncbi:MAG TPA: HAMP domain-containing sensor histidine kinase [Vicinamibacteria bacterium]
MGCLFAVWMFLGALGLGTLLSTMVRQAGLGGHLAPLSSFAVVAAAMLVLVLAAFFGVMRRFGFPLGDIVAAADRVATGDFTARVLERGPRSLRSVARAFNGMTARLQAQDQQRRHLMADIAHELRTPLTVIQGRLEGLLDGVYPRDDAGLGAVLEDTRMLARLVEDLGTLANAESGTLTLQKEPTDLPILVQDVVNSFAGEAGSGGVAVRVEAAADLPLVEIDPLRIREVLSNLLSNALRHTPRGGAVLLAAGTRDGGIEVRVTDTGPGIAPEELPRIFDRFYKGRASRGSGLGLTIARNLVVAHGGGIRAESGVGQGTAIIVTLPIGSGR